MEKTNREIAEGYYRAMAEKKVGELGSYLHPDVEFHAPLANVQGREAVLEAAKRFMAGFNALKIRATVGSDDQVVVINEFDCPAPIGSFRAAALVNGLLEAQSHPFRGGIHAERTNYPRASQSARP